MKMTDFRQQYKEKTFGFGNTNEGRLIRVEKHEESRKHQRTKTFNRNRKILDSASNTPRANGGHLSRPVEDRLTRLMKWKVERDRRKNVEKTKKKPPFKVGVVHHRIYSPVNKEGVTVPVQTRDKSNVQMDSSSASSKRITRATEKRLIAKAAAAKMAKTAAVKIVNPVAAKDKKNQKREASFAPINHKFEAPSGLSMMPLFGRIPMQPLQSDQISNFAFPSPKRMTQSRKHSTSQFRVDNIDVKDKSTLNNSKTENAEFALNAVDTSVETVTLKLSSDEQETLNSSNETGLRSRNNSMNNKSMDNANISKSLTSSESNNTPSSARSNLSQEPVFFSPYVVSSRGKSNARKEQQIRRGLGRSLSKDSPTKSLNISIEDEERTAQYFLFLLNKEVDRLNELCEKWEEIKLEADVTEDAQYQINQAVGQTNLLINKKFARFRGLVADCETGQGQMLVTSKDLQGFWDMMYAEVKNCDMRFSKLEKLRSEGWVEEQPIVVKPVTKKKATVKKKPVVAKQSSIRALILAERKKKVAQQMESEELDQHKGQNEVKLTNSAKTPDVKVYSRKLKSVTPNPPRSTPAKENSRRSCVFQRGQLPEMTANNLRSPLTIIKISQKCKIPEVRLNDTVTYAVPSQTPGKSILKRSKDSIGSELHRKSVHKVNFNDDEIPIDEERQTRKQLALALEKIDSYDLDTMCNDLPVTAERKLNFDDDSSDESQNTLHDSEEGHLHRMTNSVLENTRETVVPIINVHCPTPSQGSLLHDNFNTPSPTSDSRKQDIGQKSILKSVRIMLHDIATESLTELNGSKHALFKQLSIHDEEEADDSDVNVKTLRNRTLVAKSTPRPKRRSSKVPTQGQELEQKENERPSKGRRKSSMKVTIKEPDTTQSQISLEDAIDNICLDDNTDKRRRSSRRSVKFSGKDCTGCTNSKPVHPVTPHVRRSKARSSESKRRNTFTEDLISWETPEKPPERIRRSQNKKI